MQVKLFTPIRLGSVEVANRISIPPMCMYSARSGIAQPFHLVHYGRLALSGAGLVCIEAAAVTPEGRITEGDLGLWSDECEAGMARIVETMKSLNPEVKVIVQISHAGRKASAKRPWEGGGSRMPAEGGWRVLAPSPIPFAEGFALPRALTFDECAALAKAFGEAAARAVRAGADGVEIHMAHGYLIHEFLSPLSNQRIDEYGGALENRMRFACEVMDAVRMRVPEGALVGLRISATDWVEDGFQPDEAEALVRAARVHGLDFVDVSTGGNTPDAPILAGPGYQVEFAARMKRACDMPVIAVGLIANAWQAETLLAEGSADMIDVGRAVLDDPNWGWHAARDLGVKGLKVPAPYERGIRL